MPLGVQYGGEVMDDGYSFDFFGEVERTEMSGFNCPGSFFEEGDEGKDQKQSEGSKARQKRYSGNSYYFKIWKIGGGFFGEEDPVEMRMMEGMQGMKDLFGIDMNAGGLIVEGPGVKNYDLFHCYKNKIKKYYTYILNIALP